MSWTTIGTTSVTMAATASIGLVVTSHNTATVATAAFDNVAVGGAPAAVPTANSEGSELQ
jgi:hypothetical protein